MFDAWPSLQSFWVFQYSSLPLLTSFRAADENMEVRQYSYSSRFTRAYKNTNKQKYKHEKYRNTIVHQLLSSRRVTTHPIYPNIEKLTNTNMKNTQFKFDFVDQCSGQMRKGKLRSIPTIQNSEFYRIYSPLNLGFHSVGVKQSPRGEAYKNKSTKN